MRTAIVTGGGGFIGSHLVRHLINKGIETHLILRKNFNLSRLTDIQSRLFIHELPETKYEGISKCFASVTPDVVFHLASHARPFGGSPIDEAQRYLLNDIGFLLSVVKAAAEALRPPLAFVRVGSLAEYGDSPLPYSEEKRLQPSSPYQASMGSCTLILRGLQHSLPFRVVQARLALVYGPSQSPDFLVAQLLSNLKQGKCVNIRNGNTRRDLIFVDDVIEALVLLAQSNLNLADGINICTGVSLSMREVAEIIISETGVSPSLVSFGDNRLNSGSIDLVGSPELAARILKWQAKTTFLEGVRLTINQ